MTAERVDIAAYVRQRHKEITGKDSTEEVRAMHTRRDGGTWGHFIIRGEWVTAGRIDCVVTCRGVILIHGTGVN